MIGSASDVLEYVAVYGPVVVLVFTFLETSMLFPFLPSEVVVPAAAALVIVDVPSFLAFVLAAGVGGTVGGFVPFYVFRGSRVGETDWLRERLHISADAVERAEEWYLEWGASSVLWGRFLPGLRSLVSIPAGITGMGSLRFGVYTAVGTSGFAAGVGALVWYGRQQPLFEAALGAALDRPILAGVVTLVVAGVGWASKRAYQRWAARREARTA